MLSFSSCPLGQGHTKETGNHNVTAISENHFSFGLTHGTEWSSAHRGNGNATRQKTEKLKFQATEQASLLTTVLLCSFLVSAVL
jgi:hypothetical protein